MNEITRIHLGREPFTISVEAHESLKKYLADIEKNVHDNEVVNEVELRMSELLIERGITSDKVVLTKDVQYLKDQLGDPDDFSDDAQDLPSGQSMSDEKVSRKFFRNTDNAIVAGVAAGLSSYSGLDTVIIRLIFVLLTLFGSGLGIVIYLVLWLVMPAAETASEKLQMQGKPVTLEALKDSVAKSEINGAARRINNKVLPIINSLFRISVKLVGVGFILVGLFILSTVSIAKAYMILHNGRLIQEDFFPVGAREEWLLAIVMGLLVISALFIFLTGVATFKRKWPIRGWLTGVMLAIFLVGSVASIALTADAFPRVRDRYETSLHTTAVKNIDPFNKVETQGNIDIAYISSPNYGVNLHYSGNPDLSKIIINVSNGTLHINSTSLDSYNHCNMLCVFPRYNMTVQVFAPNIGRFVTSPDAEITYPDSAGVPTSPIIPAPGIKQ